MSKLTKINLKNVTSGLKIFSDILAGHGSLRHDGFSLFRAPQLVPLLRPNYEFYKQTYSQKHSVDIRNFSTLSPIAKGQADKETESEEKNTCSMKWTDTVNNSSSCISAFGLPRSLPNHGYYDVSNPQCPPPSPKPCPEPKDDCPKPSPVKKGPVCPPAKAETCEPPKKHTCSDASCPCKKSPKGSPCTRKFSTQSLPLLSASCPPKPPACPSKKGPSKKGPICPPQKKGPECPSKKKKGGGCGKPKKTPGCPSKKKGPKKCRPRKKSGSKCGSKKKSGSKCRSKKKSGSKCRSKKKSGSKCGAKIKRASACPPRKGSKGSSTGPNKGPVSPCQKTC